MVLVDTSVWIRFLTDREPYATELDSLLERDEVAGHEQEVRPLVHAHGNPLSRRTASLSLHIR